MKFLAVSLSFLTAITTSAAPLCDMRSELYGDVQAGRFSATPTQNNSRDFMKTAQLVQREFSGDFARLGRVLKIVTDWKSEEENAFASNNGRVAEVHLLGAYARAMTEDSFLMVACHELGHHLAGAPYYSHTTGGIRMSTEGQSDYFATSKCMRRVLKNQDNRAYVQRYGAHYSVRIDCNHVWGVNTNESFLCMRSIMAAMNLRLRFFPNRRDLLNQRDYTKVGATLERHPEAQCRFDTHRAGALCPVSEYSTGANCRPGRVGQNSGARPSCWFYN